MDFPLEYSPFSYYFHHMALTPSRVRKVTSKWETLKKFSSCRGVAFEIKPHTNPFSITTAPIATTQTGGSGGNWFPCGRSSNIFPSFHRTQRSGSCASSHFCDLDQLEDEDYHEDLSCTVKCMEEGHIQGEQDLVSISEIPILQSEREQAQKPKKLKASNSILSVILLDQGLFTVYKRLFVTCLALNLTFLILSATGHFQHATNRAALFSIGNILALTLCRSEACLRVVFYATVRVFGHSWVPLRVKTATTSILQSLGGIHSGCGVSSVAWLIYALVETLRESEKTSAEIIAVASAILFLLSLSSLAAFPLVRHLHHNVFERTHRFAGWTALALLWVFILLTIFYDPKTKSYNANLLSRLMKSQEFWLTAVITILIILPWTTVRRVKVNVSAPSTHASIIKFEGGVKPGILGRISPSPLSEWHAFGIISDGKKEHMMLAGAVGDFTRSLVTKDNFILRITVMIKDPNKIHLFYH